jgi:hypothetical protein
VSFSWSDRSGGSVFFGVFSPGPTEPQGCAWRNATVGSCSFLSAGGNYTFRAAAVYPEPSQLVIYQGIYEPSGSYLG